MEHHPHETRHTFITKVKKFKMDEYILKRIVGHSIPDITENVYTHREFEELRMAMEMIKE
jgi:integrase